MSRHIFVPLTSGVDNVFKKHLQEKLLRRWLPEEISARWPELNLVP